MITIKRAVGAFALALTMAAGVGALATSANAAAAPDSGPVQLGYWPDEPDALFPGTTAGGRSCNAAGKTSGQKYRCDLVTIGGVRVYALYLWID